MGKQNRRKRKGLVKTKLNPIPSSPSSTKQGSLFLQRLRHADPRTRHATLAALLSTRLNPEELETMSSQNPILTTTLLQAIRERVMDTDLECAQAAAECLANYVTFNTQSHTNNNNTNNNTMADAEVTAGWTIVMVTRLNDCHERLMDQQTTPKNQRQWWALTVQCLHTLCGLIETNEQALERLSPSHAFMTLDSVVILLNLLELSQQELARLNKSNTTMDIVANGTDQLEQMIQDVCVSTTRTLHSALDDNLDLYNSWSAGWNLLTTVVQNGILPTTARLHAAGCLVAVLLVSQEPALQQVVVSSVMPYLHQCLTFHPHVSKALLQKYLSAMANFKEEEDDAQVEKDVIQTVNERKEPARHIARRQKQMNDEKKREKVTGDNHDMDDDETKNKAIREYQNQREVMESAKQAWHNSLLPLQVALEITANLTSVGPSQFKADEDDDMMIPMDEAEWGPDQEDNLLAAQSEHASDLSAFDSSLMQSIVDSGLPHRLLELLHLVCTPLVDASVELPTETIEELGEVQSKCGACLRNCLAEHFPCWGIKWKDLRAAFESNSVAVIASSMTFALRSRSQVRQQVQPDDLDFILQWVTMESSVQRDMVEMVGILCSHETHPKQVNSRVCSALMKLSLQSGAIVNEVLNALMDIYSEDECHPDVFRSLQVLAYFQKTVPLFKTTIATERPRISQDEVEQWRESALNASRFIMYKKGLL